MEFELRKLQASDLFALAKIIKGIGLSKIKDAIDVNAIVAAKKSETSENAAETATRLGVDIVTSVLGIIVENLENIENDVYRFAGSVANMKPADVAKMDIGDFIDLITAICRKEEFADFFKRASKLIGLG